MTESHLQRLVAVMDQLRSPGGCPWDAEQTHESLLKYLLEESYEFIDAVEKSDRAAMREELGDVLLQVYFHARMAQESDLEPFNIEDVAREVADKLIRRHPHVFGDTKVSGSEEVLENWEAQKRAEKGRTSAVDGVALSQPALSLVTKLLYRAEKNGVQLDLPQQQAITESELQERLLALIASANSSQIDVESVLRNVARDLIEQIQIKESR
ncbi:MAG: MazG family protein [Actinomycetes bacterium]